MRISEPITDPDVEQHLDHTEQLPSRISPSRISDFMRCPYVFYCKTILNLPTPPTYATIKGQLMHAVAERVFDYSVNDRTMELAHNLVNIEWEKMISITPTDTTGMNSDETLRAARSDEASREYTKLVEPGSKEQDVLFSEVKALLDNWFGLENLSKINPTEVLLPNDLLVDGREFHVEGSTQSVQIHGFVDRLDSYEGSAGQTCWSIGDYKTGRPVSDAFLDKSFFQLRLYAKAFQDMFGISPTVLRLLYVSTNEKRLGVRMEYVNERMLMNVTKQIDSSWKNVQVCARKKVWPAKKSALCPYCFFQNGCPAWQSSL